MPNPTQIATIVANGIEFSNWTTVSVERSWAFKGVLPVHMRVTAVEPEIDASGVFTIAQRLNVGDRVQCFLAGILVVQGVVTVRQVSYDSDKHGVEIVVSSVEENVVVSTVKAEPGQYRIQTLQQIGSTVFGAVGVGFSVTGAGASKVFERISEHVGETRFAFIERLCRMRDVHMVGDGQGNVQALGSASGGSSQLTEGQNILRARIVMRVDDNVDTMQFVGQMDQHDFNFQQGPSSSAQTTVGGPQLGRSAKYACEQNADNADCAMRANFEADLLRFEQIDCTITVKDWLRDDGTLWYQHVSEPCSIYSPLLFPQNTATLFICGVVHRQSNEEGTVTDVILTNQPGDSLPSATGTGTPPDIKIGP